MNLLEKTTHLIKKHGIYPKKSLGQNFCVDATLLKRMVDYSNIDSNDEVLEVGAGLGFLTDVLSKVAKKVYAIEIDPKLTKVLEKRFEEKRNVIIINEDVLTTELPKINKVVANPPYSISSPLIFKLLELKFQNAIITLQEDFAKRLTAEKGNSNYGRLTVMVYRKADINIIERIPKSAFFPSPKVESALIHIVPRKSPFNVLDEEAFSDLVKSLFNQRRKKIKNALITYLRDKGIGDNEKKLLVKELPNLEKRVHMLAPEELGLLSDEVHRRIIKDSKTFYKDYVFLVFSDVYKPSEDTFLIADNLKVKDGEKVLDVGTGCGILAIIASERAKKVIATDVNPHAVKCSKLNAKINERDNRVEVRRGRLFEVIKPKEKFDLIIFNPPYLPVKKSQKRSWINKAWSGSTNGRSVIDAFLMEAPNYLEGNGRILLLQSTLSDKGETRKRLEKAGLKTRVIAEKKVNFETLFLLEAKKNSL